MSPMNNPWKLTAIGMALVMLTALVTGLVVANWSGPAPERDVKAAPPVVDPVPPAAPAAVATPPAPAPRPAATKHTPAVRAAAVAAQAGVPSQVAVDECNRQAAAQVSQRDKTTEVVKDAAIGAVIGAAVGAAGGAVA